MHKSIIKQIENSFIQARSFFEESILEINNVFGFPEYKGKHRITEWGGTSSAISALALLGNINPLLVDMIENSKYWLINQNKNGSWNASGFYSLEATTGVMNDLYELNIIPDDIKHKSLNYIWSNYNNTGFFITPGSKENPHVYTTYLTLKCMTQNSNIPNERKAEIKKWLLSIKNYDNNCGISNACEASVPHSIYALYILNYCGVDWDTIKSEYKDLISWILNNYNKVRFSYEEFENTNNLSDSEGQNFLRLRISHYILPLVGNFCIDLNNKIESIRVMKALVKTQRNGGWGPPDARLTMWATYQSIAFLTRFKNAMLKRIKVFDILRAYFPFLGIRMIVTVLAIGLFYLLIKDDQNIFALGISLLANIIFAIFPWLIKRQ